MAMWEISLGPDAISKALPESSEHQQRLALDRLVAEPVGRPMNALTVRWLRWYMSMTWFLGQRRQLIVKLVL